MNIWSYIQACASILAMSSGTMNVNGDYLSWKNMQRYIVGTVAVIDNKDLFYPGKFESVAILNSVTNVCSYGGGLSWQAQFSV